MARNLDFLESRLRVETAWLEKVEACDAVNKVTKLRKKEIKAWAYDVEDVLGEWEFQELRRRYERDPVPDLLTDPSFSCRVNELKQKYEEIARDSRALRGAGQGSRPHARNAPDSSLVDERGVFDDEAFNKEAFVEFLLSAEEEAGQRLAVVPIGGPPGVGKTILAKLAYNDPKVSGHFGRRGWVTASQHLEMMGLMEAIGESLTGKACSSSQLGVLQDHLKQKTDGQRILLVLDDVQDRTLHHWEQLLVSFGGWAGGSVIILTSSHEHIFKRRRMVSSFDKECLSSYHCWSVFQEQAFGALPPDDDRLKEIGKKIAMECEGLPSVAKALGAKLRSKRDVGEWEEFLQRDMWDDVKVPELRRWYRDLPAHLKRCFVYCSMFPRGHLFRREELVRLWMAQGFIQGKGERSLADVGLNVGLECFDDLQSMFLCRNSQADEESFVMYKFYHALAQSISEGECLTVGDGNLCSPTKIDLDKARHLSLTPSNIELVTQSLPYPYPTRLRTFVVFQASPHKIIVHINLSDEVFNRMNRLRVLDVSNTDVASLPTTIVSLKHLRYLNLSGTKIKNLHVSVFELYNLQTLNLSYTDITELPDLFGNLKLLCFLFLNHTKIETLPKSICELCNLHTLDLGYTEIRDLQTADQNESGIRNDGLPDAFGNLSKLCNLGLNVTKIRKLPESIGKLSRLQTLHLGDTKIEELPKTIGNLKGLKFLCLNVSKIQRRPKSMWELYNLHTLQLQGAEGDTFFECLSENQSQDAEDENPNNHAISIYRDSGKQLNEHSAQTRLNHDVSDMPDSNINNFIARRVKYVDVQSSSSDNVLEIFQFQPHNNLKRLDIRFYGGVRFPMWLDCPSFSNLTHVVLKNCTRCKALPRLGQLPRLEELDIDGMPVERVGRDFCGHVEKGFPSLEKLSFQNMCKWKEWDGVETGDFPSLDELILFNCPKLKGVPCHLPSLTKLKVERCAVNTIPTTESLRDLELCACDNLSKLPSLGSVHNLTLMYCQNLASLPRMKSLEKLWIEECEKLLLDSDLFSSDLKICRLSSTVFYANANVGN